MLISIVTITLNDLEGLQRTGKSVENLRAAATGSGLTIEWIVKDGLSTLNSEQDRTRMEEARARADVFVSEADSGIYNAMNRGFLLSEGDYVWFLNSGDEASAGILPVMEELQSAGGRPGMIWGGAIFRFSDGDEIVTQSRAPSSIWFSGPVCHQAVLFSHDALAHNAYGEHFRIAGDYDLIGRLVRSGTNIQQTDEVFCVYDAEGASTRQAIIAMKEEVGVRTSVLGLNPVAAWSIGLVKLLYQWSAALFPGIKKAYKRIR